MRDYDLSCAIYPFLQRHPGMLIRIVSTSIKALYAFQRSIIVQVLVAIPANRPSRHWQRIRKLQSTNAMQARPAKTLYFVTSLTRHFHPDSWFNNGKLDMVSILESS